MIRGGTIHTTPDLIAKACRRRTDVGMAVMPIDAPCTKHTFHVAIVAWSSDMIHDLIATVFDDGCADFGGECVQYLIPGGAFPFALSTFATTFQRVEDAFRIVDLVDGGRAFGAVAATAAGMRRIAFKLLHPHLLFVYIGKQAAGGLAVETDGGNE